MVNYGLRITLIICRSKWFDIYIYIIIIRDVKCYSFQLKYSIFLTSYLFRVNGQTLVLILGEYNLNMNTI